MTQSIENDPSSPETRRYSSFTPQYSRFRHPPSLSVTTPYNRQYSHIYTCRLNQLRPRILSSLPPSPSKKSSLTDRVIDLREGLDSLVIGTLVKTEDEGEETLVLEDESGRVALLDPSSDDDDDKILNPADLATGVVMGVRGTVRSDGVLVVRQTYLPSLPPIDNFNPASDSSKILLLSGLALGSPRSTLRHSLLVDYLAGHLPSSSSSSLPPPSRISRVIIAGGCISACAPPSPQCSGGSNSKKGPNASSLLQLDIFLSELLASGIPVTLLPGRTDPTNVNLPHQPLHPCLLPHSTTYKHMLTLSTNPFEAVLDDKLTLGITAGAAGGGTTTLDALRRGLKYSHVCPDAPSSVSCFPFLDTDPFVIPRRPHVYFAGGCDAFEEDLVEGTRIVCVPRFEERGEGVVLDLGTLDCEVLRIDDGVGDGMVDDDGN